METPFPPFEPESRPAKRTRKSKSESPTRLRDVPFRMLVPNLITLMAICSGLTAIRLASEDRFQLAIIAILFAAILDALDGRVARLLKSSTEFGAQMDSLADFVNFGVAPALVLYMWVLSEAGSIGWIAALIYAICGCLRLARFNVMLDDPNRPNWMVDFFTGVPAPAGALIVLLPVYLGLNGLEPSKPLAVATALYAVAVGLLMVSNLPTFSGKRVGKKISSTWVVPMMILAVLVVALLFSFPWLTLTAVSVGYIAMLPLGYRSHEKRSTLERMKTQVDSVEE